MDKCDVKVIGILYLCEEKSKIFYWFIVFKEVVYIVEIFLF